MSAVYAAAVALVSVLVAFLRGGRLRRRSGLRQTWLPVVAFAVQLVAEIWLAPTWRLPALLASYGALLAFTCWNVRRLGIIVYFCGLSLNLLVMGANGGRMPVDLDQARALGADVTAIADGSSLKHTPLDAGTRFPWLGDVIPVEWPWPRLLSAGDLVALVGVFQAVQEWMRPLALVSSSGQRRVSEG